MTGQSPARAQAATDLATSSGDSNAATTLRLGGVRSDGHAERRALTIAGAVGTGGERVKFASISDKKVTFPALPRIADFEVTSCRQFWVITQVSLC